MSEASVKTIKRDYVYVSDCESAEVVLSMIDGWFEDYNKVLLPFSSWHEESD